MKLADRQICNGCGACYSICHVHCISMEENSEGFLFPQINEKSCINCGICRKTCPMNKTQTERTGKVKILNAFAVINKNEEIRRDSSSGGVFTILAEKIIDEGGVVFGAKFNENWEVIHDYTETKDGVTAFRGSKYVQSWIGNTYKLVKKFLTENRGRKVLFTGTPCQIGGLKSYLQKDYEKLITVDIICYGVPSPKVWQKYVEFREGLAGSKVAKIAFRRKKYGWMQSSVLFAFTNGTEYCKVFQEDLFISVFFKNLCLRKSCYSCGFKTTNRISDITIADFWGVKNVAPEMFDDKGTSLVLLQSPKGKDLFDKIKSGTTFIGVNFENAVRYNPAAFRSADESKNREKFMKNVDKFYFDKLAKKYTKANVVLRALRKIKRALFIVLKGERQK